jgi:hypothetical protein
VGRQAGKVLQRGDGVEVEPQLRRLDAHLGVEPAGADLVEQVVVVIGDRLGLGHLGQVLAEARE